MTDFAQKVANLEKRLKIFEDKDELATLLHSYCSRPDHHDFAGFAQTFTEDGTMEFEQWPKVVGREAIAKASSVEGKFQGLQHTVTNLQFSVDGSDSATGTAYLWFAATPEVSKPEVHYAFGGPYTFHFKRTTEGWRISRMHLKKIWAYGQGTEKTFTA